MRGRALFARLRELIDLQSVEASTGLRWWKHPTHRVDCDTHKRIWRIWGGPVPNRGTKPDAVVPFEAIELMYDEQTLAEQETDAHHLDKLVKSARVLLDAFAAANGDFRHGPMWDLDYAVQYFEGKAASAEPADDVPTEETETETQGSDT